MDQAEATKAPNLSVSLVMTAEQYAELQREQMALDFARAFSITGTVEEQALMAQETNQELRLVKDRLARVKQQKEGFVEPAKKIIANAQALFDPAIAALVGAELHLKGQLTAYLDRENQRLEDVRRVREAEERAARQKAEQEAAAARARANQEAEQRRREAAEAEERRVAAEREGNDRAAKTAAAEKAKAEEQAAAAVENGEVKANEAQLAASAAPTTAAAVGTAKLKGYSTRENFVAELAPATTEDMAKAQIIEAIAVHNRKDLMPLLALDMTAANRLAKALKSSMNVPGLRAMDRPVGTSRKS